MLRNLCLPLSLFAVNFYSITIQATPIDVDQDAGLLRRNNQYALKCSNAPSVVAGAASYQESYADAAHASIQTELQPSGSEQAWMKYLWCTLNTRTYTFFDYGSLGNTPPPGYFSVYEAFTQAAADVHNHVAANGDGQIDKSGWYSAPPNTNVELWVQSKGVTLTWGVLGAALTGLATAASNYNSANKPMSFQINDGHNGEMGIGYAALSYPVQNSTERTCVYDVEQSQTKLCKDWGNDVGKYL